MARADGDEYYVVLSQRDAAHRPGCWRTCCDSTTRTAPALPFRSHPTHPRHSNGDRACLSTPFPTGRLSPLNASGTTLCVGWTHSGVGRQRFPGDLVSDRRITHSGGPGAGDATQDDGKGPAIDAVYLPPGRSAYVRATGLSGDNARAGTRYLITDTGVRFAIHDDDAAHDLGLPDTSIPAPWPVLAKLPAGQELSRANALVAQDALVGASRAVGSTSSSP